MNRNVDDINENVDSNINVVVSNKIESNHVDSTNDVFAQVGHFEEGQKVKKKKEEDVEVTEEELNSLMSFILIFHSKPKHLSISSVAWFL
jgi:Holliday junction resolvase